MTRPPRGRADFLELGSWNVQCSMCGRKRKSGDVVQNWQGLWRCPEHNEARQPQDFVRAPVDNQLPPFVQTNTYDYVYFCDGNGMTSIAGFMTAGCWVAGYISPLFDPNIPPGD